MPEPDAASPQPMLRGEKVWLKGIEPSEQVPGVDKVSDATIAHFAGFKAPLTRAGAERFANRAISEPGRPQTFFMFGIVPLGEQAPIGNVSLRDVDQLNGSAELSIVLGDPRLLGKGYGTDAVHAICDFGFGELRLERIHLEVYDYNERAIRSYQKSGFQTDAVQRKARFHRGAYHDVLTMSILRDDWLALPRPKSWDLAGP
jgi:RimJ/RimL family protein N-acetyltransferase